MSQRDSYDDDWEFSILIYIAANKTLDELEESLSQILGPIKIRDHSFSVGGINCKVSLATPQPSLPESVQATTFDFYIEVPISTSGVWSGLDQELAISLVQAMRTKFLCKCLVVTDDGCPILFSASNETSQINSSYPNWKNGRFSHFLPDRYTEMSQ